MAREFLQLQNGDYLQLQNGDFFELQNSKALPDGEFEITLQAVVEPIRETESGTLIKACVLPWLDIAKEILSDAFVLDRFAKYHREFEEFIAACYERHGYDVILTPQRGDLGIDVIVSVTLPGDVGRVHIVDQCKAFSRGNEVSADHVRALVGALRQHGDRYHKGIVTTTSTFAPGVEDNFRELISCDRLMLRDGMQLRELIAHILQNGPPLRGQA